METYRRRALIIAERVLKIDTLCTAQAQGLFDKQGTLGADLPRRRPCVSQRIYQVGELAREMRDLLEMSYAHITVEGELSTLNRASSGHWYFTLKDDDAQIRCAFFKRQAARLSWQPAVGDRIRIRGKISVYTARGDLQCIVQHLESAGEGQLFVAYEKLKARLASQGIFDEAHKRPIPPFAANIGVISSLDGAALQDILSTLQRRCPSIPITIYPSLVQGTEAATQLINALTLANQAARSEVLILARGGGSMEDLWCFNDEQLALTIAQSSIPVISAVGHETDFTIADFVADVRAATPTAAAELASPDQNTLKQSIDGLARRASRIVESTHQVRSQRLDLLEKRLVHPAQHIRAHQLQTQQLSQRLRRSMQKRLSELRLQQRDTEQNVRRLQPTPFIASARSNSAQLLKRLQRAVSSQQRSRQTQLEHAAEGLHMVSPLGTLQRGYAITRDHRQQILRRASETSAGQSVTVQLSQGALTCTITDVNNDD